MHSPLLRQSRELHGSVKRKTKEVRSLQYVSCTLRTRYRTIEKKKKLNNIESQQVPGTTVDEKCIDSEGVDEMETDDSIKKKVKKKYYLR